MTVFQVTPSDLKRSKEVTPNWYTVKVVKVYDKPSSKGDSKNTVVEMEILNPGPFCGVPLQKSFNEKAQGTITPLAVACGVTITPEIEATGFAFDPTSSTR